MRVGKLPKVLQEIPMSGGGYAEAYEMDGDSLADNRGYPAMPHSKGGSYASVAVEFGVTAYWD